MSRILFADELAISRTIAENNGALERLQHEKKKQVNLSLINLGVMLDETSRAVPLTLPEKIKVLEVILNANEVLQKSRPEGSADSRPYVLERCRAVRVVVPQISTEKFKSPAFSFWVSPATSSAGQLCLMEGNGSDAGSPFNYARCSTYTVLQSLVHFARQSNRIGVLGGIFGDLPPYNPYAKVDATHPPSLHFQFHNVESLAYDFWSDPEKLMLQWNVSVSTAVEIITLYSIREYGPEAACSFEKTSTFGYALSIRRAA